MVARYRCTCNLCDRIFEYYNSNITSFNWDIQNGLTKVDYYNGKVDICGDCLCDIVKIYKEQENNL